MSLSAVGLTCLSLIAAKTNTWTTASLAGHWAEAANWAEDRTLEAGDFVRVPDGLTAVMNDADIAAMKNLIAGVILPRAAKSTLEFNVTGEENIVTYVINASGIDRLGDTSSDITIVKNGPGKVSFVPPAQGNATYGCHLIVNDGTLQLPESAKPYNLQIPKVTVNSPGVLITPSGCANAKFWAMNGLAGDGIVTNPTSQTVLIYIGGSTVFSGKLLGAISLMNDTTQTCTGEFRTSEATSTCEHGLAGNTLLGLESIGGTSPDGQTVRYGSIGRGSISFRKNPGIRYLGTGETAYPNVYAYNVGETFTFDGGPHGGLELAKSVSFSSATATVTTLILRGTNSSPCTLGGTFTGTTKGGVTNLRKMDSGTWRAAEALSADFTGLVSVEDGTLQFGSLAKVGAICSLGRGSAPVQDVGCSSEPLDSLRVPYAWLLGRNATTGTLEYVGTAAASCSSRPLAVRGTGRVTTSGGALSLTGASAAATGVNTLVLSGETDGNVFGDIVDGTAGVLSVAKEGSGTWRLCGELAFSGGIDVKAGTLEIGKASQYTFYRFESKERLKKDLSDSQSMHYIGKLALFNAEGVMQNADLAAKTSANNAPWLLQPGECSLRVLSGHSYWTDSNTVDKMFTRVDENGQLNALDPYYYYNKDPNRPGENQLGSYPWLDDPDSWAVVYFRLPANADEVVSYDLGMSQEPTHPCQPYSWTLSGSYDGQNWVELSSVVSNAPAGTAANTWYSNGAAYSQPANGRPIACAPATTTWANGTRIGVAPGATIRAVSGVNVTVNAFSASTAGFGTVDGFAFAEQGTVWLSGEGTRVEAGAIPGTLVNCTGDMSGWAVAYNGVPDQRATVRMTAAGLDVFRPGTVLIFR